jgi:hypothetical protein
MISRACTSISDAVPWKPACLVDQDARIGQCRPFALGTTRQQHRPHAGCHADARCGDQWLDKLHGVVDGETCVDLAARAVDVHLDLAVRIVLSNIQELGNDEVGDHVVDVRAQEHDAVLQEQREDVVAALTSAGLLDHHRHGVRERIGPSEVGGSGSFGRGAVPVHPCCWLLLKRMHPGRRIAGRRRVRSVPPPVWRGGQVPSFGCDPVAAHSLGDRPPLRSSSDDGEEST